MSDQYRQTDYSGEPVSNGLEDEIKPSAVRTLVIGMSCSLVDHFILAPLLQKPVTYLSLFENFQIVFGTNQYLRTLAQRNNGIISGMVMSGLKPFNLPLNSLKSLFPSF